MISYIPLCGAPGAGKTETSLILARDWGVVAIDDSWILREATKVLYGLTDWHVSTQEGKSSQILVGETWKDIRTVMGELGLYLEKDDPYHIPRRALQEGVRANPGRRLCFGSVRLDQAKVFRETGKALVVEIVRPGFAPVNKFDHYDKSLVDVTITNDYDPQDPDGSSERLRAAIAQKIGPYLS